MKKVGHQKVIKDNMTDLAQFDVTDSTTTKLKHPNRIPKDRILMRSSFFKLVNDFALRNLEKGNGITLCYCISLISFSCLLNVSH
ncbi:hypothetical protein RCO48_11500 [Peribacillus frigoritolerans]|nr:hypothetical protein [Peribacillus frigoritolerans]